MTGIITGASRGIGAEIALNLATTVAGKVFIASRDINGLQSLKNRLPGHLRSVLVPVQADLSTEEGRLKLITAASESQNGIDFLVNNAGGLYKEDFMLTEAEKVRDLFELNYLAPALLIKDLLPLLQKSGKAHVVNIGSMGGFQGSVKFPGLSHYSASKAALAVLTECLALEYKKTGISFNCLAIGAAQTGMLEKAFPGYKAPLSASQMAGFIADFTLNGHRYFNGKILPVSLSTP